MNYVMHLMQSLSNIESTQLTTAWKLAGLQSSYIGLLWALPRCLSF